MAFGKSLTWKDLIQKVTAINCYFFLIVIFGCTNCAIKKATTRKIRAVAFLFRAYSLMTYY
jgi:preprotein translocase subunit SecG